MATSMCYKIYTKYYVFKMLVVIIYKILAIALKKKLTGKKTLKMQIFHLKWKQLFQKVRPILHLPESNQIFLRIQFHSV